MRTLSNEEVQAVSGGASQTDLASLGESFRRVLVVLWLFLQGKSWNDII